MSDLRLLTWPMTHAAQAIAALADAAGLPRLRADDAGALGPEDAAARLGLEAEPVSAVYAELDGFIRRGAPALVRLPDGTLVALLGQRGRRARIVAPDRTLQTIAASALRDALAADIEKRHAAEIDALLDAVKVPEGRRPRARVALLRERLGGRRITLGWLLQPAQGAPISAQVRWSRLGKRVGLVVTTHAVEYVLGILGWWFVGKGALEGRLDIAWIAGWALVLFSQIPFRLLSAWYQGVLAIDAGALIKQRLLAGAVQLPVDSIRSQGIGQLLGKILESEAVESLSLNGGVAGLTAALELVGAGIILAIGAGGLVHVALLLASIAVTLATVWRYHRHRERWTASRLTMTHDLVERMAGHRTRLAQQDPAHWHDGEDESLDEYMAQARGMDACAARLVVLIPRGFVLFALAGLAPGFATGDSSRAALAIAMGGMLLGYRALRRLVVGVASLSGAAIAWRTVTPLLRAATLRESPGLASNIAQAEPRDRDRPIVEASELEFRYAHRGHAVLHGCSLRIHPGDRILVEGNSGSGKSTLGAILAGLREPASGLLLVHGLDRKTLGFEGWRRRVVAAPQFHENHVFSSSFAFNLLMGRAWPPTQEDLELAEALCRELDLGPLLARMPAGLYEMVGETGWQLSHGEKGRLFAARALLQGSDVLVLDETFAALDPHTLRRALDCAVRRANALLVIAHP